MNTVRAIGDKVEIKLGHYDPRTIAFIKSLPTRKYYPGSKSWAVPLTNSLPIVEKLERHGFVVDPGLRDAVTEDALKAQQAILLAGMKDTEFESPLPLRSYQRVGAAFIDFIGSGVIGDEPGVGKSLQALAVAEKMRAKKVLIFCPASVKWQWADEIRKFVESDHRVVVIHGTPKKRADLWYDDDQRFYIANYEQLRRDLPMMNIREWDIVVADEATKVSNPQAEQSKLVKQLRAKRRIAMTGTPISNRPDELWNIFDFCIPGYLGNYREFTDRYCIRNNWGGVDGYQNLNELGTRIRRYIIRRLKEDVLTELPPKITSDIPFVLSEPERELYRKIKQEILYEIEHTDIAKLQNPMTIQYTLVKMLRLRQLADSTELIGHNEKSSKIDTLKDLLPSVLDAGIKAIIFTEFAEMADILVRELQEFCPLLVSGKVAKSYSEVVKKFNEENEHQILVMTSAGQFGLNIQRASVIVHYDQAWSLAKMEQREGRAHRSGQTRGVQVYNLLARGTVDYYIKKLLGDKSVLSRKVLGDDRINMADIVEMLRKDEV